MSLSLKNKKYLFIGGKDSDNTKKIKKYLKKKNLIQNFEISTKDTFVESLKEFLVDNLKSNKSKSESPLVVLCDTNNLVVKDAVYIPGTPNGDWDILYLEYDAQQFDYKSEQNTSYWCKMTAIDSGHFVVNPKSIRKVLSVLKEPTTRTRNDFFKCLNEKSLGTFGIKHLQYSDNKFNYIRFPSERFDSKNTSLSEKRSILKEYSKSAFVKLQQNVQDIKECDYAKYIDTFERSYSRLSENERYSILPEISFICIVTDTERLADTLYSYFKLNYPRDKTELIIVDDVHKRDDPRINSLLPKDQSIKYINIFKESNSDTNGLIPSDPEDHQEDPNNQDTQSSNTQSDTKGTTRSREARAYGERYPHGYKLNIGMKYTSYSIVCHLFDTNTYFVDAFRNILKCFIMSGKDLLISGDMAEYDNHTEKSYLTNVPDISNMIYRKDFWNIYNFEQSIGDSNILIHKWICFRKQCVAKLPFMHWSFKISNSDEYTHYRSRKSFNYNLQRMNFLRKSSIKK